MYAAGCIPAGADAGGDIADDVNQRACDWTRGQ